MSSESNRQLLTIGVAIVAVVVAILLYVAGLLADWLLIVPVVFLLVGLWMLALGAIRMGKPIKYERSGFSTMAIGLIAVAVGGAWFLFGYNWLLSLVVILLVVAALAIAAAMQRK